MRALSLLFISSFLWIIFASFTHHLDVDHHHELQEDCQECLVLKVGNNIFLPEIDIAILELQVISECSNHKYIPKFISTFNGSSVLSRAPPVIS